MTEERTKRHFSFSSQLSWWFLFSAFLYAMIAVRQWKVFYDSADLVLVLMAICIFLFFSIRLIRKKRCPDQLKAKKKPGVLIELFGVSLPFCLICNAFLIWVVVSSTSLIFPSEILSKPYLESIGEGKEKLEVVIDWKHERIRINMKPTPTSWILPDKSLSTYVSPKAMVFFPLPQSALDHYVGETKIPDGWTPGIRIMKAVHISDEPFFKKFIFASFSDFKESPFWFIPEVVAKTPKGTFRMIFAESTFAKGFWPIPSSNSFTLRLRRHAGKIWFAVDSKCLNPNHSIEAAGISKDRLPLFYQIKVLLKDGSLVYEGKEILVLPSPGASKSESFSALKFAPQKEVKYRINVNFDLGPFGGPKKLSGEI